MLLNSDEPIIAWKSPYWNGVPKHSEEDFTSLEIFVVSECKRDILEWTLMLGVSWDAIEFGWLSIALEISWEVGISLTMFEVKVFPFESWRNFKPSNFLAATVWAIGPQSFTNLNRLTL